MDYLSEGLIEEHRNVSTEADITYINKIIFVVAITHGIHFGTSELIKNKKRLL